MLRTVRSEDTVAFVDMFDTAIIEKPLLRAEEGASCDFIQPVTAKMHPRLFGGPAVLIGWTRGFASPNSFGFAFVGDKTGVVLCNGRFTWRVLLAPPGGISTACIVPKGGFENDY